MPECLFDWCVCDAILTVRDIQFRSLCQMAGVTIRVVERSKALLFCFVLGFCLCLHSLKKD